MKRVLLQEAVEEAAQLFADARRLRRPLPALPAALAPRSFADAAAIQFATAALLGERVAGYKVNGVDPAHSAWGVVLSSRLLESGVRMPSAGMAPYGVEAEVAFRLDRDIAASEKSWTIADLSEAMTAVPAIEIVASRFESMAGTPPDIRNADFMSNGALVCGAAVPGWRTIDLGQIPARLQIAGKVAADTVGGHAAGDPRLPVLAFLSAPHRSHALHSGQIITSGTLTGMPIAKPGDAIAADLGPLGQVRLELLP